MPMFPRRSLPAALLALAALSGSAMAANLNHYYDFTSGVTDLAGTANGQLIGNANLAGGTLNLDGLGSFVAFQSFLVPTAGSYSVAFFVRGNGNQAPGFTEVISQGTSGGPGFYIGTDFGGNSWRVTDSWQNTGVPFGAVNQWAHLALVVDAAAGHSRLYVNGAPAAQLNLAIVTAATGTPTRLGSQFAPFGEYFKGSIDELRIYDGALTGAQVAQLSAVPEPGTAASFAAGLLALGAAWRRRCGKARAARL